MNINDQVAAKIKEIRESKNVSQATFAKQIGMSNSAYSRIESGEVQLTVVVLEQISEKLNVSIFELMDFKSTQVNNFNNNQFAQNGGNPTINISLPVEEFYKWVSHMKEKA